MSDQELISACLIFLLAFGSTLVIAPISSIVGKRYRIIARARGRHLNEGDLRQVSKLGGVSLFIGFSGAAICAQFLPIPRFDSMEAIRFLGLMLGGTFIFIIGLLDDIFELNAILLGIGQILAAGIAVAFQVFIETINNPFTGVQTDPWPLIVTNTLSMFWLGLMMNTTNFMDGLDGLAAGVAFIAGTLLFVNSAFILDPPQTSVSLLPLSLMGTSLAFLLFNFYPASVFMGGGAYYLGFLLGTLSIIGGAKMATILLVMGLPLMDLTWQAAHRIARGKNPMHGDRGHIHFRLLDMGFSQRQIVLSYYAFCTFFGILTLATSSQLFKLIALSVMISLIVGGFFLVNRYGQTESSGSS